MKGEREREKNWKTPKEALTREMGARERESIVNSNKFFAVDWRQVILVRLSVTHPQSVKKRHSLTQS